jgi:hypothetical protein
MTKASDEFDNAHLSFGVDGFLYHGFSAADWFSIATQFEVGAKTRLTCRAIAEWLDAIDKAREMEPPLGVLERAVEIAKNERSKSSY